ncbi:MAG: 1-acyl-sn-glycerol-3-phosphate acyltransferase [Micavibrio sp.]|nr:1-acyl-sn-glycerol-3-phosphate acyltransferase [Micavibrio sp.]
MRSLIASFKIFLLLVICLITVPLQTLSFLLLGKGRAAFIVPFLFHRSLCFVFGIKVRIQGEIKANQQVVYVGNHLSYLDIILMGSFLRANFVSKDDVKGWPLLGLLATLSHTLFISRTPAKALKSIEQMKKALNQKRSLIVFPEGTSSTGQEVQPFKSSFFDIFLKNDVKESLLVQPFTIGLIKTDNKAVQNDKDYDLYAWYGDMGLQPHIWALGKSKGAQLIVRFHPPKAAKEYENRKTLSIECYEQVSRGLNDIKKEYLEAA